MTEMRPETEQPRWNNKPNNSTNNSKIKEVEDDLNIALDEALENYDLATSWMETDGEKEVVRK